MPERLKKLITESQNIVFFGGAGVSTESGIPDFRSEDGLFKARQEYGYAPETLLSYDFFTAHSETFYRYYANHLIYADAKPNPAHLALARLEQTGKLRAVITQNIDGLHQAAGSKQVYELHGSVHRNTCMSCGQSYDLNYMLEQIKRHHIPRCGKCRGKVRPDVVLYGEGLDQALLKQSVQAIQAADTMIVGGTSLAVWPAAGLLQYFKGSHLVLINKTATPFDAQADLVIHVPIGEVLRQAVI